MRLDNSISKLLYQYNCVIIPDFGGFVAKQKSASFHPITYSFQPPQKEVGFNSDLAHNDGLLANELCKSLQISYQKACELIANEVAEYRKQLDQNQFIEFAHIGKLKQTHQILEFFPDEHQNFDLSTFGLPKVKANYILRNQETNTTKPVYKNQWKSYAAAIAFAIVVGASGFVANNQLVQPQLSSFLPMLNTTQKVQNHISQPVAPVIDINQIEEATKENTVATPQSDIQPTISYNSTPQESKDQPNVEELDLSIKKYQIIGGSFKVYSKAMEHQAKLKREGFSRSVIIGKVGNFYMVALDTFHDLDAALEMKRQVEKTGMDVFLRP